MLQVKKYSEDELVSLLQNKDAQAFSYLYDNYSAALYGIIYKMVEEKELAEDILQEAFVKIWNSFASYNNTKGRLFTWMLNVARNLTIDTLRSKGYKKQAKIQGFENSVNNVTDTSGGTAQFDSLGIRRHLTLLKNDQKQIIDLAYFSGFTQEEIAVSIAVPARSLR